MRRVPRPEGKTVSRRAESPPEPLPCAAAAKAGNHPAKTDSCTKAKISSFYRAHWDIARQIFLHAVEHSASNGSQGAARIRRAMEEIDRNFQIIGPALKSVCEQCKVSNPALNDRRKDFLTRMFVANTVELCDEVGGGRFHPYIVGLRAGLESILSPQEVESLNERARNIYVQIKSDDDASFSRSLLENFAANAINEQVIFYVFGRFRYFNNQRNTFICNFNRALQDAGERFTMDDALFNAFFGILAQVVQGDKDPYDETGFNIRFGDGAYEKYRSVIAQFSRWRESVLGPVPPREAAPRRRNSLSPPGRG